MGLLVIYQVDRRLFRGSEVLVEVLMALALPIRGRRDLFRLFISHQLLGLGLKDRAPGNLPLLGDQIGIIADLFAVSIAVFD